MPGWADIFRRRRRGSQHTTSLKPRRSKQSAQPVALGAPAAINPEVERLSETRQGSNRKKQSAPSLGTNHLGKFAYEDEMPSWLARKLAKGGQICTDGVIPVLAKVVGKSHSISYAYFCHPCVQHVSKLSREGHEHFQDGLPSVFQIQDLIESAWDLGHNSNGRLETGGIIGTRKYIGTPEARMHNQALRKGCVVRAFRPVETGQAWENMIKAIEAYFAAEWGTRPGRKHQGHSLTVVGFERSLGGGSYLYVFDPSSRDPESIKKHTSKGLKSNATRADSLVDPYRRGETYLSKYPEFEVLFSLSDEAYKTPYQDLDSTQ
ncbi:peptidase C78 family protein [Metarhizium robertsii]|uniref:Peptidase C78 family protein n=1 Tax=Metarhizium robertsii TaxID=568076 RepID=A0A0A1V668_9HYPO|nr:peptidase C78 family protein [Metarhizium robertsii]